MEDAGDIVMVAAMDCNLLALDKFELQVFKRFIIKIELPFERSVGQAPTALEHLNGTVQELVEVHDGLSAWLGYFLLHCSTTTHYNPPSKAK